MTKAVANSSLTYPSSTAVKRAIHSCTKAGLSIGAVEISPDGVIRVISQGGVKDLRPDNDFDRLDAAGALG